MQLMGSLPRLSPGLVRLPCSVSTNFVYCRHTVEPALETEKTFCKDESMLEWGFLPSHTRVCLRHAPREMTVMGPEAKKC